MARVRCAFSVSACAAAMWPFGGSNFVLLKTRAAIYREEFSRRVDGQRNIELHCLFRKQIKACF